MLTSRRNSFAYRIGRQMVAIAIVVLGIVFHHPYLFGIGLAWGIEITIDESYQNLTQEIRQNRES